MSVELSEQELLRRKSLTALREMGIEPYPAEMFEVTTTSAEISQNLTEENKEEKEKQKLSNEIDALTDIFNRGPQYWNQVLSWGTSRKMLTEKEASILKMTANMFVTGRIISDKLVHYERLEKFESHFLWKTTLIHFEFWSYYDNRTA